MELFFDYVTVLASMASVCSGAWVFSQPWARRDFVLADFRNDDPAAAALALSGISTALSLWHLSLMAYWSQQDGPEAIGSFPNTAFEMWHISICLFVIALHIFWDASVKRYLNQ